MIGGEDSSWSLNTTHPLDKTSEPLPTTDCTYKGWDGEPINSSHAWHGEDTTFLDLQPSWDFVMNDHIRTSLNEDNWIPSNVTTSNVGSNSNPPQPRSFNEKFSPGALAKEVKISTHL